MFNLQLGLNHNMQFSNCFCNNDPGIALDYLEILVGQCVYVRFKPITVKYK